MSLPNGFLDELKSRLSIADVVGRKVLWDKKKSQPAKGDLWAPCPFHHEKTSSFHVIDSKGFYKCFGCQASGDAIKFVQETENVGFMEAVEILATEVGLPMPARDPQAREKADRNELLAGVMDEAVKFYRLSLNTRAGSAARAYLDRRGLGPAPKDRFEIGYAPEGWHVLWAHLTGKGIAPDLILEAGLAKPSDRGGAPYDAFRDRIMFPIRDGRGRCIAFGGRAMSDEGGPKYINSSDTSLFDKGRALYNIGPARAAAGRGQPLIVAEGYMDVIALSEAGFGAAVAPLGTAVTDRQLQMLWRMSDEPVFALDGDRAGIKAAERVIDLAFPVLTAGKSLRFALMPPGKDPDDILREQGAEALGAILEAARPMVDVLWSRETAGKVVDSPERRAMLDKSLRETLRTIADPSIRAHYGAEIKKKRDVLFGYDRPASSAPGDWRKSGGRRKTTALPTDDLRAMRHSRADFPLHAGVILAVLASQRDLLPDYVDLLERMDLQDNGLERLRRALLDLPDQRDESAANAHFDRYQARIPLEALLAHRQIRNTACFMFPNTPDYARLTVEKAAAELDAEIGWQRELRDAVQDMVEREDEGVTWRLGQAAESRAHAGKTVGERSTDMETAPNGVALDREELDRARRQIEQITGRSEGDDPPR